MEPTFLNLEWLYDLINKQSFNTSNYPFNNTRNIFILLCYIVFLNRYFFFPSQKDHFSNKYLLKTKNDTINPRVLSSFFSREENLGDIHKHHPRASWQHYYI